MTTNTATSPAVSRRIPVLIAGTAALVGVVYGYDQGSIASAILFLGPAFHLTTFLKTLVVSSINIGTLFGTLIGGRIANGLGRKRSMLMIGIGYALLTAAQATAPEVWTLVAIRLLLGVVIGVSIVAAPTFIAETSPRRIRGRMLVTFSFAGISGIVIAYFLALALAGTENWRLILGLGAVPAVAVAFMILCIPDSPRWYLMKNRRRAAVDVLRKVEPDEDPEALADLISADLNQTERGSYRQLFQRPLRRAGIFVIGMGLLIQITGINAVVYYGPTILSQTGFDTSQGSILTAALLELAGLAASVIAFFLVDRWGRRPVLLSGLAAMAVANLLLVVGFIEELTPLIVFALFLFLVSFSFGYSSLLWVYVSESLPAQMRSIGAAALLTADTLGNIAVSLFFLNALTAFGGAITFGIFLAISIVAIVFIAVLAPETKNRKLEDIRGYWENGGRWPTTGADQRSDASRGAAR